MSKHDDFGEIYGTPKHTDLEQLRSFEWAEIVEQINSGVFTNKINWVLKTQEMPAEYNKEELTEKHLENYRAYMVSLLSQQ